MKNNKISISLSTRDTGKRGWRVWKVKGQIWKKRPWFSKFNDRRSVKKKIEITNSYTSVNNND